MRRIVEGNVVTVIMSIVTIFALVGDDIRIWTTNKDADPYFYFGLIISMLLFTIEIILNSIVVDDFKYSFFFWLDIIATLSLIPDIRWLLDILGMLVGATPSYESANVIPGTVSILIISNSCHLDRVSICSCKQSLESCQICEIDPFN